MTAVQSPSDTDFFNLLTKEAAEKAACANAQKAYEEACYEVGKAGEALDAIANEYKAAMAEALETFAKDDSDLARNGIKERLSPLARKYHEALSAHKKAELRRRAAVGKQRQYAQSDACRELMYVHLKAEGLLIDAY